MIVKSLKVKAFGRLNPGAALPAFHSDLTVIHGPNEVGKSTFLRALTFGLFEKHNLSDERVLPTIVPVGARVSPEVEIVFEVEAKTWRLHKSFGVRKAAELFSEREGVFEHVATGQAAEERLRELLGSGAKAKGAVTSALRGIGEILIVDQGELALPASLSDLTKDRLRGVIQQIGTGGDGHALLQRVKKAYEEVFTPGGGVKKQSVVHELDARILELEQERKAAEAELRTSEEIEKEIVRLLVTASEEPDLLPRLEARVEEARQRVVEYERVKERAKRCTLEVDHAKERCERHEQAMLAVATAEKELTGAAELRVEAKARATALEEELRQAAELVVRLDRELDTVTPARLGLEAEARLIVDLRRIRDLRASQEDLSRRLQRYAAFEKERTLLEEALRARSRPKRSELTAFLDKERKLTDLNHKLERIALKAEVEATTSLLLRGPEREESLAVGSKITVQGQDPLLIEIPGVLRLRLTGPVVASRADLERERTSIERDLREARSLYGTTSASELEALTEERARLEAEVESKRGTLHGLFETSERAALAATQHAEKEHELQSLTTTYAALLQGADLAGLISRREGDHEKALGRHESEFKLRQELKLAYDTRLAKANSAYEDASRRLAQLDGQHVVRLQALTERRAQLPSNPTPEATLKIHRDALQAASSASETLHAELEVLGDPASGLEMALAAADQCRRQVTEISNRLIGCRTLLEQSRAKGLWKTLGDLEEKLERLTGDRDREQQHNLALQKLYQVLQEEQNRAVEAAVAPVSSRVTRMLRHVHGQMVSASFGQNLLPETVSRADEAALPAAWLSAGAKDSLALVTRLAFGELYSEKYGRHLCVLDDPLVNCDQHRRTQLIEILLRATRFLQVVIFTCHPEHYRGIPPDRGALHEMKALYTTS